MGFVMANKENSPNQDTFVNIQVLKIVENGENIYSEDPLKFNNILKDIVKKNIYEIKNQKIESSLDELNDYLYSKNKSIKKLNIKLKRAKEKKDYSTSADIIKKILKIKKKDLKILNAHLYLHLIKDMDEYENSEKRNTSLRYVKIREIIDEILEIDPENQELLVMKYYIDNKLYLTKEDIAREEEELKTLEKNLKYEIAANLFNENRIKEGLSLTNKIFLEYEDGYDFWDHVDSAVNGLVNSEENIEFLKGLVEENPKNIDVQFKLGDFFKENGEYETAIKYYDIAISSGDEIFKQSGMLEKVRALRKLKRFDEALDIIERGIESEELFLDFAREKCFIYVDMGKYELAIDTANEFKEYYSGFPCLIGYIYLQWKKYKKAEKYFRQSNKLEDNNFDNKLEFHLAISLKMQKKYGDALKYLKLIPFNKHYAKYYDKAQDLIAEIESMNLTQEELKVHEEEYELKINEAANLIDKGKYEEGLTLINNIFLEHEEGYEFWDYNDYALNKLANTKENIEFLKGLVEENPKNFDVHFRLGKFYGENEEYETAIEHYNLIIDLANEIQESFGNLYKAKVLRKLKRFDEAISIVEWGFKHGDDVTDFMEEKCFIHIDMEEFDLASKTIDEFSKYRDLSCARGYLFLNTKKYDQAAKCFKKSVSRGSTDIFRIPGKSEFYLGWALKEESEFKQALKYLKGIKLQTNNKKYYDKAQDLIAEIENELMVKQKKGEK